MLSLTFGISPVPLLLESSLPPLRVGTSIHPSLVCISFGGLGATGAPPDFVGQACFAPYFHFRRFADPRVVMWFAFSLLIAASDAQGAVPRIFLLLFLAPRLQPLTVASLPLCTGQQPW